MARHRPRRPGFTLVEMLVVILILAILMALLVPAIAGAIRGAKEAQVAAEMNNLSTALASFKEKFGDYPPSRLYCSESGYYPANNALAQRSLRFLNRFFPRMALSTSGAAVGTNVGQFYDFNNNGTDDSGANRDAAYVLQGPECLVFFLGGMPTQSANSSGATQFGLVGFDRSPTNPFRTYIPTATATAPNRTTPMYEFVAGRLDDTENPNGNPCYLDPMGSGGGSGVSVDTDNRPYAYFNSYGNDGYDPNDYNCTYEKDDDNPTVDLAQVFNTSTGTNITSVSPNPYTTGLPASGTSPAHFHNPNSFQLVAAGRDRQWGLGGEYNRNAPGAVLPPPASGAAAFRLRERDNVTNFSGGRLD